MTIYPTVKPNVSIDRTATTAEYLIWNSLGKVRVAATPEQLGVSGGASQELTSK
jgi:hypothetical protein